MCLGQLLDPRLEYLQFVLRQRCGRATWAVRCAGPCDQRTSLGIFPIDLLERRRQIPQRCVGMPRAVDG